eukprot:CAMPEP_0202439040 /NCGR_PEP_ID=MMETSP1345-20130828/35957_1 /ASSEMBLY_ACC=CAM_ASM_000843 /TAXON_ID=342563 /ORGANISM="Fabrea Fabrea salina" /LENGTH=38 /DNA_ID= /DNA_START= /DNA_END= /DNA_ORIENTATION=
MPGSNNEEGITNRPPKNLKYFIALGISIAIPVDVYKAK